MHKIENVKIATPFLAHDGKGGQPHYGIIQPGQVLMTGQDVLEDVKSDEEWLVKAEALGYASRKKADSDLIPEKDKERMSYQAIAITAKKLAKEKAGEKDVDVKPGKPEIKGE
jgi:hypothetical protein